MSSILTNNSAMVALQTLKGINSGLEKTQSMISTGKEVGNAKDNAAVWAISKVMEADVTGFKAISDSLALGESTVALARDASETVTDLLKDIKDKIVGSQEENVDRAKIQTDIEFLTDQIESVVGAAQFNGLNLLSNQETGGTAIADIAANAGSGNVSVLSSLDRAADGTVTASDIGVAKQDLGVNDQTFGTGTDITAATAFTGAGLIADGASGTLTVAGDTATAGRAGNAVLAGDSYQIDAFGSLAADVQYVARDGDTVNDIAKALGDRMAFQLAEDGVTDMTVSVSGAEVTITNNTGADITSAINAASGGTAGGGLNLLSQVDVTTEDGAAAALGAIEGMIQNSIDSAAAFGSSQNRIEIQSNFVGKLVDSMESGIGSLVDADMEETSARLQALQVQQQLGIQALSIANQQPQSILSLFR